MTKIVVLVACITSSLKANEAVEEMLVNSANAVSSFESISQQMNYQYQFLSNMLELVRVF